MEFLKSDGARTGLFFGATSGVITTIGLIVGLNSGTRSITAVLGGILVIAVADAMSDALGIHLAEESDPETDHGHVWAATIMTFVTKFVFSISFAVPLLLLPLALGICIRRHHRLLVRSPLSRWHWPPSPGLAHPLSRFFPRPPSRQILAWRYP